MVEQRKLTKAQRELLQICADDPRGLTGAASHYAPAKLLVAKRLAVWLDNDPFSERLYITDAGRAALNQEDSNAGR